MSEVVRKLIAQLDVQGDHAAEKVIAKIVKHGKRAAAPLVQAATDRKKPRIRKWALLALGKLGDPRGAPLLLKALKDERMTVRLNALKGLGRMKYKKGVKKIAALLKDESGGIRVNALYTLLSIGDRSAAAAVVKGLSDSQWYVRQTACEACGAWKLKAAMARLKKLSTADERKAVRKAAKEALAKL